MKSSSKDSFHQFCATLDSAGGHILIALIVILIGGAFQKVGLPQG